MVSEAPGDDEYLPPPVKGSGTPDMQGLRRGDSQPGRRSRSETLPLRFPFSSYPEKRLPRLLRGGCCGGKPSPKGLPRHNPPSVQPSSHPIHPSEGRLWLRVQKAQGAGARACTPRGNFLPPTPKPDSVFALAFPSWGPAGRQHGGLVHRGPSRPAGRGKSQTSDR